MDIVATQSLCLFTEPMCLQALWRASTTVYQISTQTRMDRITQPVRFATNARQPSTKPFSSPVPLSCNNARFQPLAISNRAIHTSSLLKPRLPLTSAFRTQPVIRRHLSSKAFEHTEHTVINEEEYFHTQTTTLGKPTVRSAPAQNTVAQATRDGCECSCTAKAAPAGIKEAQATTAEDVQAPNHLSISEDPKPKAGTKAAQAKEAGTKDPKADIGYIVLGTAIFGALAYGMHHLFRTIKQQDRIIESQSEELLRAWKITRLLELQVKNLKRD